jgi:hypothetical protein
MRVLMAVLLWLGATACQKPETKVVVPEVFRVKFQTSQGDFIVEASRAWAPRGADRFHELVNIRYFDEGRFFRVVRGFIAQFGVHRDFDVHGKWRNFFILDDPPREKNLRGTLAFAQSGPHTRATEILTPAASRKAPTPIWFRASPSWITSSGPCSSRSERNRFRYTIER